MTTSTDFKAEAAYGGHPDSQAEMTATKTPLDMFALTEHDFTISIETGEITNIGEHYITFKRLVVTIYHGAHCKDEIRSALHLAEDHLTSLLEDNVELDGELKKFVKRAIKFIQKYSVQIADRFASQPGSKSASKATVAESEIVFEEILGWNGKFTEISELISALLLSGKVECSSDAVFIRTILRLFGIKKTTTDYYKTVDKMYERSVTKNPDGIGRCHFLIDLLDDTETEWKRLYLSYRSKR